MLECDRHGMNTHVVGIVADFPREEGREHELFAMAMSIDDAAPGAWGAAQGKEGNPRTVSSTKPRILLAHLELYIVPWPSCERTSRIISISCAFSVSKRGALTSCAAAPNACRGGQA